MTNKPNTALPGERVCVNCGHDSVDENGVCAWERHDRQDRRGKPLVEYCGCKCEFDQSLPLSGGSSELRAGETPDLPSGLEAEPPLEDPTQFTTRSFAMIWNEGHSIRLINRDDARQAISIPWDEISALRALLKGTYPVGGGEV